MQEGIWFWVIFNAGVLALLALDLLVFHRKPHAVKFREAVVSSLFWILLAAAFAFLVFYRAGSQKALEFTTSYLIEEALSADNLFVFLVIFRFFKVEDELQHKVLFWGIIGALVARGIFIVAGVSLLRRFEWIIYLFGAFLIYTGVRLFRQDEQEVHPEKNPVLKVVRRFVRVTESYEGSRFLVRRGPELWATPLFFVLLVVETTDVLFATDSIPAVLAVSHDPFIVYTSNVFAVLGLRSIYFALAGMMGVFHFLNEGLAVILVFIGVKMLISHYVTIRTGWALGVVAGILVISIIASLVFPQKQEKAAT
ncbi:MAG TPA: TerC family protein [Candidatus Angelobacter sp.]|nr:TerC family protein [Candidatus Angelobacter sp.]